MNPSPINTVVIGYGAAGQRIHVPLIRLAPQLRLRGVCSSDPAKRARIQEDLGCRSYERFEQVLDDRDAQLIVLATPNIVHAPQAVAAMRAGKHVVIDKPMCLSVVEADELLRVAGETGRALSIFQNRRFDSDYLTLCQLISDGELGDVRWIEMAWQRPSLPRSWRRNAAEGGGRFIDLGSHMIDQILQLFASPVASVFCRMHRDFEGLEIDSHAMLTMVFADGRTAIVDTTSYCHAPKPRMLALGSRATFVKFGEDPQEVALAAGNIDAAREDEKQWGAVCTDGKRRTVPPAPGRWRCYYEQMGAALQMWPEGVLPVRASEGARVIRVLEAAAQSAASGRVVALGV